MKNYSLKENSYKQMYLINKFEKNILENSLSKMNIEKSPSSNISKSSVGSQTDVLSNVNNGNTDEEITLIDNGNTDEEITLIDNHPTENIKDKTKPLESHKIKTSLKRKNKKPHKSLNTLPSVKTRGMSRKLTKSKGEIDIANISPEVTQKINKDNVDLRKKLNDEEEHRNFHGWKW